MIAIVFGVMAGVAIWFGSCVLWMWTNQDEDLTENTAALLLLQYMAGVVPAGMVGALIGYVLSR